MTPKRTIGAAYRVEGGRRSGGLPAMFYPAQPQFISYFSILLKLRSKLERAGSSWGRG